MRRYQSALLVALVPALAVTVAIGAPRRGHRPTPPKKTTTPAKGSDGSGSGSDAGSGSAAEPVVVETGSGSGSAAPVPPPVEVKVPVPDVAKVEEVDVDTLRQEYLSLRDELFKSRARANAVASALYSTRIQIKLTYTTARYYNPAKSQIRLDGATVYEDATGAIGGDDGVRFEGYVAPGKHLVTFRIEAQGKDDDTFTSATESQVVVKAVANKDLLVVAKAKDGGDIAYAWKKSEKGSYGLGLDIAVRTADKVAKK